MADYTTGMLAEIKKDYRIIVPEDLDIGGIVGVVDVVDCVSDHPSKWFGGDYGWVLQNPRRLPFRKCKGFVKFFKLKSHPM